MVGLAAGLGLALAVLTTARIALFVPLALLWVGLVGAPTLALRGRRVLLVALPVVLLVGGWIVRNWVVVGAPVLTTESGESFWGANNEWTFDYLPDRSIDLAVVKSYEALSPERQRALNGLEDHEVARDRLVAGWGWEYIHAHPALTLWRAGRKLWSAASGRLSPSEGRSRLELTGYSLVFLPVHLLAAIGLWRARRQGSEHLLVAFVLLGFAVTTATFWAHTSHKSYLDVFLFIYAAAALVWSGTTLKGLCAASRFFHVCN